MNEKIVDILFNTTKLNCKELVKMDMGQRINFITTPIKGMDIDPEVKMNYYILASKLARML